MPSIWCTCCRKPYCKAGRKNGLSREEGEPSEPSERVGAAQKAQSQHRYAACSSTWAKAEHAVAMPVSGVWGFVCRGRGHG